MARIYSNTKRSFIASALVSKWQYWTTAVLFCIGSLNAFGQTVSIELINDSAMTHFACSGNCGYTLADNTTGTADYIYNFGHVDINGSRTCRVAVSSEYAVQLVSMYEVKDQPDDACSFIVPNASEPGQPGDLPGSMSCTFSDAEVYLSGTGTLTGTISVTYRPTKCWTDQVVILKVVPQAGGTAQYIKFVGMGIGVPQLKPAIEKQPQASGTSATVYGALKYDGCHNDITTYGFVYTSANGSIPDDPTAASEKWIAGNGTGSSLDLDTHRTFSYSNIDLSEKGGYTYKYRAYVQSACSLDNEMRLSDEIYTIKVLRSGDCTYLLADTVYATVDASATADECKLLFNSISDATTFFSGNSVFYNQSTYTLNYPVVVTVKYGDYTANTSNIINAINTGSNPTNAYIIKSASGNRTRLSGLKIVGNSKNVYVSGFDISGQASDDATTAVLIDNATDVTLEDVSLSSAGATQAVLKVNASAVKLIRNSFRGSQPSLVELQNTTKALLMHNVLWADNTTNALIRITNTTPSSTTLGNVGMYYNTLFISGNHTGSKVDMVRFGTTGSTVNSGYSVETIAFRYNNCYSYSTSVSGRNTDPFLGHGDFVDGNATFCTNFSDNNFWSKYDKGEANVRSAFAFGCSTYYLDVESQMCMAPPTFLAEITVIGNMLNKGKSVLDDKSGYDLAPDLYNDRNFPSLGSDAVRPATVLTEETTSNTQQSHLTDENEYIASSTAVQLMIYDQDLSGGGAKGTDFHDFDYGLFAFANPTTRNLYVALESTVPGMSLSATAGTQGSVTWDAGNNRYYFTLTNPGGHADATFRVTFTKTPGSGAAPTVGSYTNTLKFWDPDNNRELDIPIVAVYTGSKHKGLASGWTLGAFQQRTPPLVPTDTIVWQGNKNADWDDRGNWIKTDGTIVNCMDALNLDLVVVLPAPHTTKYPLQTPLGISRYPNLPSVFADTKVRPYKAKNEQVDAGAGVYIRERQVDVSQYAKRIIMEYGATLKGVEYLGNRYSSVEAEFTAGRSEWILVGPMVKPFANGQAGAVREIVSGDFYIPNHEPHVYMNHITATGDAKSPTVSWGTPFTSLEEEVTENSVFAIDVVNQYGKNKQTASLYFRKTDPTRRGEGTLPYTYKYYGRFANESALPSFALASGINYCNNSYPGNLDLYALDAANDNISTLLYDYTNKTWKAPANGEVVKPMNGFIVFATNAATLNIPADKYAAGNGAYKKAEDPEEAVYVTVNKAGSPLGSRIAVAYNELKVDEKDYSFDTPKAFMQSSTTSPDLYLSCQNDALAKQVVNTKKQSLPLGLLNASNAAMNLEFAVAQNNGFDQVALLDKATGQVYDLSNGDTVRINDVPAGNIVGRFYLNLQGVDNEQEGDDVATGLDANQASDIYVYVNQKQLVVSSANEALYLVRAVDMSGRQWLFDAKGSSYASFNLPVPAGTYVVSVNGANQVKTQKIVVE